jgi:nicotinate-nucleotide adenylyltransferase
MRQCALYGAAFNPPHQGHLDVIQQLLDHFDEVLLVPSAAHAFGKPMAPFAHRVRMLELLLEEQLPHARRVTLSPIEEDLWQEQGQRGPVYTYNVLCRLRELALQGGDDVHYTFVVGPDNAQKDTWARFWKAPEIRSEFGVFVVEERLPVRSTECRRLIRICLSGPECRLDALYPLMGRSVTEYVRQHYLYMPSSHSTMSH